MVTVSQWQSMQEGKTVFCVEDNPDIVTIIEYHLKGLGYRVCGVADNARDAVAGIGKSRPDIVLVDIGLNGKPEGLEIGSFLGAETDIPFIYVSGQDNPEILENARKTIPSGYLMKPFDRTDLKMALEIAQNRCEV
jgi:AmiR/NasT family two-component response regulator